MDDDTPDTSVPIDTEINDNDIEAHLEASARSGNAKDDGAEGADTIEDLLEGETLDSAIEKANGKATSAEEDDGRPTTNKALEILGSIIRNHDAFDVAKEEAEIQELVNVAMEDPHPAEDGDGPPKEMSEEERIMYQIKDTIRFLQENVKQPAPNEDLSSVGVGDAKFDVKMRVEYEKLYRIFIAARRNNQGLVKKLRDLKNEIISNATKVEAAMNIFQQDRILIASLKKELKKAWSIVELSKDRELKAKDTVFNLKFEIENLKREFATASENSGFAYAARGVSGGINMVQLNMEQQKKIEELEQEKVELNNRWQTSLSDIRVLNEDIHELTVKIDVLKSDKAAAFREMDIVNGILQTKKSDQDRESRIRDKLETQIKEQAENIKAKEALVADKVSKMKSTQEVVARLEMQVRDEKLKCEKEVNEKNAAISRILRLQQEMDEQFAASTQGAPKASSQPHPESSELARYREEIRTLTRARDGYQKQVKQLEEAKLGVEVERDTIKGTNYSLVRETDSMKKQVESCAHQIEMLTKERDAAQKNFVKATGATQKQLNAVKISDQAQRTLEHEIIGFKEEAAKMRKLIYSLERDRDHHMTEYNKVQDDLGMKDEQLKMKEMLIFDGRKKITELERKRKEQQQLYESVRTDRNLYSKNLIECEDEITELKRKLKIMGHQIEQLKEEIAMKESDLAKGHFENSKLEKDKEVLTGQIVKLQSQLEEAQVAIKNRLAEENKLRHVISEGDTARSKLRKEYDSVVQARDVMGSQLIRRQEEITLLYEKIKIQTSTLNKGEIQYYERIEDIRVLKLEIKKLRRERAILQSETQNVEGLRSEIFKLHRDILKERTRVKVLEEELESPMNIHRWRKLSGSDPTMFELINKMQALQRRLIVKTEEVVEKETIINHKDKLYLEVKNLLQKQPGPEVLEEVQKLKANVKLKVRECKSLASELNMYHSQVNEYKYEIQRQNHDFQDLKKKYYELKKRDREIRLDRLRMTQQEAGYGQMLVSAAVAAAQVPKMNLVKENNGYHVSKEITQTTLPALKPHYHGPKFSGGGFNMGLNFKPEGTRHNTAEDAKMTMSEAGLL